DIIKHVSEEQKNNEENQKENDNEEKILRLLEMKRIAIVKEFGKSIEELVRESWLYSFNVINNIMSEKIFKSNTPVKEKDIKKTFFFIRSFLNELPSHVNSILRVFTKLITEKNIKMYNIDGLDSEVMKTMSSNFYIQKGMQNIYVFFKELIRAETDINEMKKIVEKYNISIEVYHNGQLLHKQNIQDYFKVYENFIRSFKTSLKSRMNTLKIKKVKIKRSELSDHINDLFKNSIRFHNDIIKMPLSERKNHINFFIKYNVISEKIANYLLEDIQKRSDNK
ncbi:MAG: hypothetical protein NZZ41_07280, partial [Candidatus Dojkabacteria bacterium]|nr:hypothetical protein [Candidatus Dojkabacteria bacterium]